MKKTVKYILLMMFCCSFSVMLIAKEKEQKADSEIINEFKNALREPFSFPEKAEALRKVKEEVLKKHNIYKILMDVVKGDGIPTIKRHSVLLLLFFKEEGHNSLPNLESELIAVLQAKDTSWYVQKIIIDKLPTAISENDRVNKDKLKKALIDMISSTARVDKEDEYRVLSLKRMAIRQINNLDVDYTSIKPVIEKELKNKDADLLGAVLHFLNDYAVSHNNFVEAEVMRFCRNAIKNTDRYSSEILAASITLLGNMIANENKKVQGSDEDLFIVALDDSADEVIIAASRALFKVRSTKAVDPIIKKLVEMSKQSAEVRDALIISLAYMEAELLYTKEGSISQKKDALAKIRDIFLKILSNFKFQGPIRDVLWDAIDLYGIDHKAYDYFDLASVKIVINIYGSTKDDAEKLRVAEVLSNLTGQAYGNNLELWVSWASMEEKNPSRKFK